MAETFYLYFILPQKFLTPGKRVLSFSHLPSYEKKKKMIEILKPFDESLELLFVIIRGKKRFVLSRQ